MSFTIAIAGKGGVGKTTVAGLLVSRLIALGHCPVLAVDADPNTCLDEVLGVVSQKSIGTVREEARELAGKGLAAGVSKQQLLEKKLTVSLVESKDFDLIAMGRPEGPGCYCFANNVLKQVISEISDSYPYIVIDNEAGLENLSRRIVPAVDLLLLVADPSKRGQETLGRIHQLVGEMGIEAKQVFFVINRQRREEIPESALALQKDTGADGVIGLPDDDELFSLGEVGGALPTVGDDNPVVQKIDSLLRQIL